MYTYIPLDKIVHVMFFYEVNQVISSIKLWGRQTWILQKKNRYVNFKLKVSLNSHLQYLYHVFFENRLLLWNISILNGNFKKSSDFWILVNTKNVGEITIFFISIIPCIQRFCVGARLSHTINQITGNQGMYWGGQEGLESISHSDSHQKTAENSMYMYISFKDCLYLLFLFFYHFCSAICFWDFLSFQSLVCAFSLRNLYWYFISCI